VNPSADSVSSHSHLRPSSVPIQGFESLSLDSPHWDSPSQKPPSPPSPVIPDVCPRPEGGIPHPLSTHSGPITRAAANNLDTMKQQLLHPTEVVPDTDRGRRRNSWSDSRDRGVGGVGLRSVPGDERSTSAVPARGRHTTTMRRSMWNGRQRARSLDGACRKEWLGPRRRLVRESVQFEALTLSR